MTFAPKVKKLPWTELVMTHGKFKIQRGFTLVELLVVLVIIASLLSVVLPRYIKSLDKAEESALKSDLATIRISIDRFYSDKGRYPKTLDELVSEKYIRHIPIDPMTKQANWQPIYINMDGEQVVYDIKSNAKGVSIDGSNYQTW